MFHKTLIALLLLYTPVLASMAINLDLDSPPQSEALHPWHVVAPLHAPNGLRPCCAFGYDLHVNLFGIPIPFYQTDNIVENGQTGHHHYNDSRLETYLDIVGLGAEHNGIVYTLRGGFIDIAHVRDSADMTLYLFSQLWPRLGHAFNLNFPAELANRQIVFNPFTPPENPTQRYTLAAWLSASLAFQIASWHEIAQWYGYESVAGFSEAISAFSPEDLYSNLLGIRLAVTLILNGYAASIGMYDATMDTLLIEALGTLQAQNSAQTQFQFDMLDHQWWNSHCSVPDKFMLRKRNYQTTHDRWPDTVPGGRHQDNLHLTLPDDFYGYPFTSLAQFRLLPGTHMKNLPPPSSWYSTDNFPHLAQYASQQDAETEQHLSASQCR